jgi:RNA polymerase sigma-70 factor (ECF subfamily)
MAQVKNLKAPSCETDKRILQEEFETVFQEILADLPEIYRTAFVLGVLHEQPYEEVAKILSCSVGNVKSRVFRARLQIAEKLQKVYA